MPGEPDFFRKGQTNALSIHDLANNDLSVFRNRFRRHLALLSFCCYFPPIERTSIDSEICRRLGSFPWVEFLEAAP